MDYLLRRDIICLQMIHGFKKIWRISEASMESAA